jgi:hypothetical protein
MNPPMAVPYITEADTLYEAIIVKLIFDLFHLLVRPAGDYLVVPT